MKEQITFDEFTKIDIRVGTVVFAERVEGSDKLLKLLVDFGELGTRQILSGIAKWYTPEDMLNMQTGFVLNIPPRKMMGMESQGMLFAVSTTAEDGKPVLITPQAVVENGSELI